MTDVGARARKKEAQTIEKLLLELSSLCNARDS